MRNNEKGVSPVIATILLIAITVVAVGMVAVFISRLPVPTPPISASIQLENAVAGAGGFVVKHAGGDIITSAFTSTIWFNLEVRKGGASVELVGAELNGASITGTPDFGVGARLRLDNTLTSGDVISVVYKPKNQLLVEVTVV